MKRTALQQAIDSLTAIEDGTPILKENIIEFLSPYLLKEREQIVCAWVRGANDGEPDDFHGSETTNINEGDSYFADNYE